MTEIPYQRKPGDYEIRILPDGRVVMVAPDETLMDIARELEPDNSVTSIENKEQYVEQRTESSQ